MLKYGMAKQHAVNKTNQLQNASGPKPSEDKAPGKRQTDRFKMKYPLITIVQRMQVKFKRLQKWIPPLLRIGLLWQDAIPFPNTDRTCVKSLSRRCLEQHWGFANNIVRFPMRNPDSASYSIVRLCTRVRSFHRDQSQWSHTMFPAIFNSFCPGTANMFCPTRAHLC